jgi:tripartite-type tricarboxylate transporter receptor subunit TctC
MTNVKLPHRRHFLHLAAGVAALPLSPHVAKAQAYPSRPVRIIVGYPAGGSADLHARLIGQWLTQRLGQQFVVENRPGASGNIGTETVVRSQPDGYTLLLAATADAVNASLYANMSFNFVRDIAPVVGIVRGGTAMVVHPSFPSRTVPEFINYAKANPGTITMATAGNGSPSHLAGELFKMMAGVDLLHVPYRGDAPALTDAIAGQVGVIFSPLTVAAEHVKAGKLRALAVTTETRSEILPGLPTVAETIPGYEASGWAGVGAPKQTPPEIIALLNRETNAALQSPAIKARYAELGVVVLGDTPEGFAKFVSGEPEKWAKVLRFAGTKPE